MFLGLATIKMFVDLEFDINMCSPWIDLYNGLSCA
jgi:hypothetical protein